MIEFTFTNIVTYLVSFACIAAMVEHYVKLCNIVEFRSEKKRNAHMLRFYMHVPFYTGLLLAIRFAQLVNISLLTPNKLFFHAFILSLIAIPIFIRSGYKHLYKFHHYRHWFFKSVFACIAGCFLCSIYLVYMANLLTEQPIKNVPDRVTLVNKHTHSNKGKKRYEFRFLSEKADNNNSMDVSESVYNKYQPGQNVNVIYSKGISGLWFMQVSP